MKYWKNLNRGWVRKKFRRNDISTDFKGWILTVFFSFFNNINPIEMERQMMVWNFVVNGMPDSCARSGIPWEVAVPNMKKQKTIQSLFNTHPTQHRVRILPMLLPGGFENNNLLSRSFTAGPRCWGSYKLLRSSAIHQLPLLGAEAPAHVWDGAHWRLDMKGAAIALK